MAFWAVLPQLAAIQKIPLCRNLTAQFGRSLGSCSHRQSILCSRTGPLQPTPGVGELWLLWTQHSECGFQFW